MAQAQREPSSHSDHRTTANTPHNNSNTQPLSNYQVSHGGPPPPITYMTKKERKENLIKKKQLLQDQAFWKQITKEMSEIDYHMSEFRSQTEIPLKPIRRVMCQEGDVGINKVMFAAESPILFAKACEVFILELTLRGWGNCERDKRKTLTKNDVVKACHNSDTYDFLVDIIPQKIQGASSLHAPSVPQSPHALQHSLQHQNQQLTIVPPHLTSRNQLSASYRQHPSHPHQNSSVPYNQASLAAYYLQMQAQQAASNGHGSFPSAQSQSQNVSHQHQHQHQHQPSRSHPQVESGEDQGDVISTSGSRSDKRSGHESGSREIGGGGVAGRIPAEVHSSMQALQAAATQVLNSAGSYEDNSATESSSGPRGEGRTAAS